MREQFDRFFSKRETQLAIVLLVIATVILAAAGWLAGRIIDARLGHAFTDAKSKAVEISAGIGNAFTDGKAKAGQ